MDKAKFDNSVSAAGKSLLEKLWDELDAVVDRLVADGQPDDPKLFAPKDGPSWGKLRKIVDKYGEDCRHWGETRGQAQGLAFAITTIENPYNPDIEEVKERAMERWEERNADDFD